MASKKAGGTAKNLTDSNPKFLGIKLSAGQRAGRGDIIVRQRGTRYLPGKQVGIGKDGSVIKNQKSTAVGVMQIMASLHQEVAQELGLDITTIEGNLGYARHLYEKQGTKPWNASKKCWSKKVSPHLAVAN